MNEELKGLVDTYLKDTNEENKKNLIDSLVSLDKENLKVYIEELKNNVTKKVDLKEESNRISNILFPFMAFYQFQIFPNKSPSLLSDNSLLLNNS